MAGTDAVPLHDQLMVCDDMQHDYLIAYTEAHEQEHPDG
jgi:hypothetical protein